MIFLVTGGSGFIGSNLVKYLLNYKENKVINVDKLTYSGSYENLKEVEDNDNYIFCQLDICEQEKIFGLLSQYNPDYILHLAAESHVDRSISSPYNFMVSNYMGTYNMLEATRRYLNNNKNRDFKFIYISTDEVYGSLEIGEKTFDENSNFLPNSPYSASKASGNHLVRSYFKTYKLPTISTYCSNNYGPYQYPEKLIPLVIKKAINGESIPIYGKGQQIRDWIYVDDHISALYEIAKKGAIGENYNIGAQNEITNLGLVKIVCNLLDKKVEGTNQMRSSDSFKSQIKFIEDRPGHDFRYAINSNKITHEIGWKPLLSFDEGIAKTVDWYLANLEWLNNK